MPSLDIRHHHDMDPAQARARVEELAARLHEKFGVDTHWDGNILRLHHAGLDGSIAIEKNHVWVKARLSVLLAALKPRIEREVREKLETCFDTRGLA